MTDEELKQLVASLAIEQQKTSMQMQDTFRELRELGKETDRKMQETDRKMQETHDELREFGRETDRKMQETDRKMQETDRKMQKTDRQIQELGKQIGGLGEKFGSFTEGMAFPSMTKILYEQFGMDAVTTRYRVRKNGDNMELDVFAYCNGTEQRAMIVEVKSHLRPEYIDRMVTLLSTVKQFLPEHAAKSFYGILAVIDASAELKAQTLSQGIYYAEIHDDTFELKIPQDFKARKF